MRAARSNLILLLICTAGLLFGTARIAFSEDMDYGDCPEPYPTLLADNGARHGLADPNLYLGNSMDTESDGQPTLEADGDDVNGIPDDEDGVFFLTAIIPGEPADVNIIASKAGLLDAWLDFNADGDFNDPGEQIFTSFPLQSGGNILTFNVPDIPYGGSPVIDSYARFRFSSAGGFDPNGPADDGEVEDYVVEIEFDCLIGGNAGPPEYPDWVAWGKPDCWCYEYQCRGDINGTKTMMWRVQALDLKIFRAAFFQMDPQLANVEVDGVPGICADLNHIKTGLWRVKAIELIIFRTFFFVMDPGVPPCDQAPVITGPYNFWTTP